MLMLDWFWFLESRGHYMYWIGFEGPGALLVWMHREHAAIGLDALLEHVWVMVWVCPTVLPRW